MTCDRCGHVFAIGDFPFCEGRVEDHRRGTPTIIGDACDVWQENGTPVPIHFQSKSDRRVWLKANGLEERVRHVPLPGTDKSPYTTNWSSRVDPYTTENARILMERAFHASPREDPPATVSFQRDVHVMTPEEAQHYAQR